MSEIAWKNRIVGHDVRPASWFLANPKNWRIHPEFQQEFLGAVLEDIGWVDEVKVNQNTGFIVDGHLRVTLALRRGDSTPVPVTLLDLTNQEEDEVLATFDPIAAQATRDVEKQAELLRLITSSSEQVNTMLADMLQEAEAMIPKTTEGEGGGGTSLNLGDTKKQIKPVLYADEIEVFEAAILLTGERNRGKALVEICREYAANRQFNS